MNKRALITHLLNQSPEGIKIMEIISCPVLLCCFLGTTERWMTLADAADLEFLQMNLARRSMVILRVFSQLEYSYIQKMNGSLWVGAHEPMARVPKMAHGNIPLARGFHCSSFFF